MRNDFYIHHGKFQSYSDKAIDCYIKSWELKGIDKEIILLYKKKYWKEAFKHLKLANKWIN